MHMHIHASHVLIDPCTGRGAGILTPTSRPQSAVVKGREGVSLYARWTGTANWLPPPKQVSKTTLYSISARCLSEHNTTARLQNY